MGVSLQRIHNLAIRVIIALYASAGIAGLLAFLATRAESVTAPVGKVPEKNLQRDVNFADFRNGSWIEASSYAYLYIHHPLFVVDGLTNPPSQKEEWVPDRRTDKKPFITVHLGRPADIRQVVIYHDGRYTQRFYTVSCISGKKTLKSREAIASVEARVVFPLECRQADAVRLDFTWDPYSAEGHIRIDEIEAWGR
jgi:hypothetical protein